MFEDPRRLHYASIFIGGLAYIKQALFPLVLMLLTSSRGAKSQLLVLIPVIMGAVLGLLGLVGPFLNYLRTTYVIRDDTLIVNSGWLWRKTRVIPLARIQNVNLRQNFLHRILGATSVQIETAAGAGVEAELAAVSNLDAYDLQLALLQRSSEPIEGVTAEPPALYELSNRQLFIAGALNNRLLYILIAVTGAFQFDELFKNAAKPILVWMNRLNPVQSAMFAAGSVFALIALGWILSVVYSFTRFYGFRMERHEKGLKLKYGLFTKIQSIIPTGRVQTFRIAQPLLFQTVGYCEIYADTAGSFDAKELGAANKLCPIAALDEIDEMGQYVFPGFVFSKFQWRQVSPKAVRRYMVGNFVTFLIIGIAPIAVWQRNNPSAVIPLAVGIVSCALLSYALARIRYRFVGYAEQDGFIASRQGVWRKQAVVMPLDRLQWVGVDQSFFQSRMGLADLKATSSSAGLGAVTIENLDDSLAYQLQDRFIEQNRARRSSWRGGN